MIDLDHDLLAARQKIVFGEGVTMRNLIELVAAGDVLHRPVRLGRWCEGDPRRHDIWGAEAPIGRVLVPQHKGRISRLLDKEIGGPVQQIRAVEILDRVEDGAVPHQLGEPGKEQVLFMAQIALERPAGPPLERPEPNAERRGLRLGHDADREEAALLPMLFDLGRRQTLRQQSSR